MLPQITIEGNLADNPELRFTPSGQPVCNFTVVSNDRRRTESGGWEDTDTTFFRVSCWRRLAENVANSLRKGDAVVVIGKIKEREYQDREGNNRRVFEVTGSNVGMGLMFNEAESKRVRRDAAQQPAQQDPWASRPPQQAQQGQQATDPWAATQPDQPPF